MYVDNEVGAAGATGRGEEVIRICGSYFVVERMREGMSPTEACEEACKRIIQINGGKANITFNDKFVAVDKSGNVGCAQIRGREDGKPEASYWTPSKGFNVVTGVNVITV